MVARWSCLEGGRLMVQLMEEFLHQLIGSLSHYLHCFSHPRWCRISAINSITCRQCLLRTRRSFWRWWEWSEPHQSHNVWMMSSTTIWQAQTQVTIIAFCQWNRLSIPYSRLLTATFQHLKVEICRSSEEEKVQNGRLHGWDSNVAPLDDLRMCLLPPFDPNPTWPTAKETYGGGIPLIFDAKVVFQLHPDHQFCPLLIACIASVVRHHICTYNLWVTHACEC